MDIAHELRYACANAHGNLSTVFGTSDLYSEIDYVLSDPGLPWEFGEIQSFGLSDKTLITGCRYQLEHSDGGQYSYYSVPSTTHFCTSDHI